MNVGGIEDQAGGVAGHREARRHARGEPGVANADAGKADPAEVDGREARIDGHVIGLHRNYGVLPKDARIEIGVRPEFVDVATPAPDLLSANIERIDDLGRIRFARVRVGDAKLAARVPQGISINGGTAGLRFDPAHVHVYADSILVEGTA